jgi:uncharacterized 2Fe-2S/4Fe-4S cluster protein (DUF4445 family)
MKRRRRGEDPHIEFEPLGLGCRSALGSSLLEATREAGVGLAALCGGQGRCGRCKVQVVSGAVSPLSAVEKELLSEKELALGFRLACQVRVRGDIRVLVPLESLTADQRMQIEGLELPVPVEPAVVAYDLRLPPPTLEDLRSDGSRLQARLAEEYGLADLSFDFELLRRLPDLLRGNEWSGSVALRGREVIGFLPQGQELLGLAIDLGTTKIAGYLVDLVTGQLLAAKGVLNPQIRYGEDVMSRISYAMKEGATRLQEAVVGALNDLAQVLCGECGLEVDQILEAVVVGNTAMHHLFLGLPVAQLGLAPYIPAVSEALDIKARDVGLSIAPGGYLHLLPNIAGFIGADHVAVLLATGIHKAERATLGLDIGTNTEITLAVEGRLLSCSCASGPAFEGAHIKDGMRAAAGAIERLRIVDSQVEYQTIGDLPPVGLCGSGVLDAVAELLRLGIVDERGAMRDHSRVRRSDRDKEFVLVEEGESGLEREIVITRRDIGEIQLAKGAVRAGINVLLSEAGLTDSDLEEVIIAGAFGNYIGIDSGVAIGMLPPLPLERFKQVGNAAGMGAKIALISKEMRAQAAQIARRVEYIELTNHPSFAEEFTRSMRLGPVG